MSEAQPFGAYGIAPKYLVFLTERSTGAKFASIEGLADIDIDIKHQMRRSASSSVQSPLRYKSNYARESLPDLLLHNGMYIVSTRLRDVMEPLLADYELVPTVVEPSQDETDPSEVGGAGLVEGYWWLNCWRNLDIVDWDKTISLGSPAKSGRFAASPLRISSWQRLALREPIPADAHFFGFVGVYGAKRFISPQLYAAIFRAQVKLTFGVRPLGYLEPTEGLCIARVLNGQPTTG
jgi:hypothetical protein